MSGPAVIFVFFILFASGLTFPMKRIQQRHANDRQASTVPEFNSSPASVMEISASNEKENLLEPIVSNVKRTDSLGDRLLNKVKERSLVKIIKKSKKPRYKLRDSILENEIFSVAGQEGNNNTVSFHEIFNSVKPSLIMSNNTGTGENILNTENNSELINTYLPLKSFVNGSEIEIVKNTVLRSKALPTNKPTNNKIDKCDQPSAKRNLKHQVRKYFRLHSSIAKELEARSVMSKPKPDNSGKSDSDGTAAPPLKIDYGAYGQTQAPRMQSIVLRWNLILV